MIGMVLDVDVTEFLWHQREVGLLHRFVKGHDLARFWCNPRQQIRDAHASTLETRDADLGPGRTVSYHRG